MFAFISPLNIGDWVKEIIHMIEWAVFDWVGIFLIMEEIYTVAPPDKEVVQFSYSALLCSPLQGVDASTPALCLVMNK